MHVLCVCMNVPIVLQLSQIRDLRARVDQLQQENRALRAELSTQYTSVSCRSVLIAKADCVPPCVEFCLCASVKVDACLRSVTGDLQ